MMDSNLHHPLWNPNKYTRTHSQARELIKICGKKGFHLIFPKHIPTFLGELKSPCLILKCAFKKNLSIQPKNLDRKQFLETLQQKLGQNTDPATSVECTTQDLMAAVTEDYNSQGKWVTTNPARSKAWWNKEQLNNLVSLRNKARRNMLKDQNNKAQKEYHHYQQLFKQKIWELKSSHWRKFLAKRGPEHA
ncbi:hypothetical protein O181_039291 [Austropuccinia psidii MF-1]|uniref:Endonuclease/exonuclease/phosphatase domain-containing protein n=1 Tax=Austropuccinia psidii MF-1 TaxID=1389203 RepID=A0A9Q3D9G7_9BASI|nr:hypothetical protein [Austropuccinia psidii MF-1]